MLTHPRESIKRHVCARRQLRVYLLKISLFTNAGFRSSSRWWTLSRVTTISFVLGITALIAVCVVTYGALTSFAANEARVARTHQVQAEIGHLQRSVFEAMIARRLYTAGGGQPQLATLRAAAIRARDHLTVLAALTQDSPQQKDAIEELQRLLVSPLAKAAELDNTPADTAPPVRSSGSTPGQSSSDVLLTLLSRISDAEQTQLRGREEQARNHFEMARTVVPIGTLASVMLFTGAVVMLNREAGERKRED
jgi:CHASE3 domain sensor protein